ncbi:MAG: hypothetical protein ABI995_02630 [Acidobacteriota bacterium]
MGSLIASGEQRLRLRRFGLLFGIALLNCTISRAQVSIDGHPFEVHAFFSQGFVKSDHNNYLTLQSNKGAFDFTDGGFHVTTRLTNKLRVGAQAYSRHVGNLGKGRVTLDWATVDYRWKDFFGIRAGRVKTVMGLYNDTQDLEFLQTWALMPQALYSLDLRGLTLSHLGGDIYGSFGGHRWGTFSYTAYVGRLAADLTGGLAYGFASYGIRNNVNRGWVRGGDLKWNTPVPGLLLGASLQYVRSESEGVNLALAGPLGTRSRAHPVVLSGQYSRGRLRLDYERVRSLSTTVVSGAHGFGPLPLELQSDQRLWYAAVAYRISKHLEAGTYHSRFYPNADKQPPYLAPNPAARHMYDQAITARVDFKTHWDVKAEGHFIDGFGDPGSSRGFYLQDNPQGLVPTTRLLVLRLGFNY